MQDLSKRLLKEVLSETRTVLVRRSELSRAPELRKIGAACAWAGKNQSMLLGSLSGLCYCVNV